MNERESEAYASFHSHLFLGEGHETSARRTWVVIALCAAMMGAEIVGGWLFGSIALIADGLHMSTHAGALLLAALAYALASRHADDPRFTFGTGKFGDLAGFSSAIVLAIIALLIGWEAVGRLFAPVPIRFAEAIPIAALGLGVNLASAWLLSDGEHHHSHVHGHAAHAHDQPKRIDAPEGAVVLDVFEDGVSSRFHLARETGPALSPAEVSVEIVRPDGGRQVFAFVDRQGLLESVDEIPEPHQFLANVTIDGWRTTVDFDEHGHAPAAATRDNNMRAALVHVMADATVSVAVIVGLTLAWLFGWLWMDSLAGIAGALVIASWSAALIRDTGAVLLDMNPDFRMAERLRKAIEADGDRIADLHLWRLGPGHLGAIVSVVTPSSRGEADYRNRLARFPSLSHLTIEVRRAG